METFIIKTEILIPWVAETVSVAALRLLLAQIPESTKCDELRRAVRTRLRELEGYFTVDYRWSNGRDIPTFLITADLDQLARYFDTFDESKRTLVKEKVRCSTFHHSPSGTSVPAAQTIIGNHILNLQ